MSEGKVYKPVAGFVQFDVNERDANGQKVRDVTVKPVGSDVLVKITVWPEFAATAISKGDFVAAEGLYTRSLGQSQSGEQREYHNISAKSLVVLPGAARTEREVVQAPAAAPASDDIPF